MLRFMKGFKASLNVSSGKQTDVGHYDSSPGVRVTGAYRVNNSEFAGNRTILDAPKKITPSMVKLPNSNPIERQSKSTSDLTRPPPEPVNLSSNLTKNLNSNSTPNVPQANTGLTQNQIKEQKKIEKKRLLEQKKRDKLAAQEQKKQEKLRREREKQMQKTQQTPERNKKVRKRTAPQPTPAPQPAVPQTNTVQAAQNNTVQVSQNIPIRHLQKNPVKVSQNPAPQATSQYSTNTLESSISRSSGPPPYSPPEVALNKRDNTGNISFAAAEDTGSWDLISQHRQQINRPKVTKTIPKQTHLDLQYNIATSKTRDVNSEA
ncbi:unnamed protein product, partial [Brenthis ino]